MRPFSIQALPLDVAIRIWDAFLLEGEVFIIRTAIGILRIYAPRYVIIILLIAF